VLNSVVPLLPCYNITATSARQIRDTRTLTRDFHFQSSQPRFPLKNYPVALSKNCSVQFKSRVVALRRSGLIKENGTSKPFANVGLLNLRSHGRRKDKIARS
jgi:hypothetical protein